jgi:aminopeptidase N
MTFKSMTFKSVAPATLLILLTVASARAQQQAPAKPTGPPTAPIQYAPNRDLDLIHVALDLNVDYEKLAFRGVVVNTLAPLREGVTSVTLYCGANLSVEAAEVAGQKAAFTRDGDLLKITPAHTLQPGKAVPVTVRYSNVPGKESRNFYWIKPTASDPQRAGFWTRGGTTGNRQWLPTWDYPNDFATSETRVTVPAGWYVVGNGTLKSAAPSADGAKRAFHWELGLPHATYLISLAGGPLSVKTAEWRGVPLMYVVPKGSEHLIEDTFGDTPDMLSFFSDTLGVKYPWPKYAQTAVYDYSGAQENVSATSLNASFLTERRKGFRTYAGVSSHELAHQWFGDLISPKDWGHLWLSEGFATYFRYLYMEHSRGRDDYAHQMRENADYYFSEGRRYRRPLVTSRYPSPSAMFDNHTYQKGAAVLHTLRRSLGDGPFFAGLRHYLTKYRHQPADSHDLCAAMMEATGINLAPFFDQWVYKPGHPVLDYAWAWDAAKSEVVLTVKQIQDVSDGTPVYDLVAAVGLITGGRVLREKINLNAPEREYRLRAANRPDAVLLDPDHDFLREVPALHWGAEELPAILRHAPNAVDRQEALTRLLAGTPSDAAVKLAAEAVRMDVGPFPAIRSVTRLGELKRTDLRSLFREQLRHPNDDRRVQAIRALGLLPRDDVDIRTLRSFVNDQSPYAVVLASVSALADWDAPGNRDLFLKAQGTGPRELRLEALLALRKADAAEGKVPLDPDPEMTRRLISFLSDFANGVKDSPHMSPGLRGRASPDGDAGYQQYLKELKYVSFIVSEDVGARNVQAHGELVSRTYWYKMATGDRVIYLRFFLTPDGKVADVTY